MSIGIVGMISFGMVRMTVEAWFGVKTIESDFLYLLWPMAILWLVGIVIGIIALCRWKKTGDAARALAIAAILGCVLNVLVELFVFSAHFDSIMHGYGKEKEGVGLMMQSERSEISGKRTNTLAIVGFAVMLLSMIMRFLGIYGVDIVGLSRGTVT